MERASGTAITDNGLSPFTQIWSQREYSNFFQEFYDEWIQQIALLDLKVLIGIPTKTAKSRVLDFKQSRFLVIIFSKIASFIT
ncbi:MAG TPA: hypothetical protein VGK38_00420 [Prolixibacteraceae bacterium]